LIEAENQKQIQYMYAQKNMFFRDSYPDNLPFS